MKVIGRLILAATVLLAQLSLGQTVCVCRITPAPVAVAPISAPCPMTQKIGCKCCAPESSDSEVVTAAQVPAAKCQLAVNRDKPAASLASIPLVEIPAILTFFLVAVPGAHSLGLDEKSTMIVPRIRPPNLGIHGLRAPPSRSI